MIGDKTILAVITARANSLGLPGKNYKSMLGKPLVTWSILSAFRSKYVDSIFVSSNCKHVKSSVTDFLKTEEGQRSKGKIHYVERPPELCTPTSRNEEALIHAVQSYEERYGKSPDLVFNLQPTSPVRYGNLLDLCIESMHDSDSDSLLTVTKMTPFFWQIKDQEPFPLYDAKNRPMRQEIDETSYYFHDNGNVYGMTLQTLMDRMCRIGENPFLYETDQFQSLQIDTDFDFQLIEKMAEVRGVSII